MTDNNQNVKKQISQKYNLKIKDFQQFSGGTESEAWLLETGSISYVAKLFCAEGDTQQTVEDEVRLYEFINLHGQQFNINAPVVIQDTQGNNVQFLETKPLILMKNEQLKLLQSSTVTREEMISLSKAVAHLHQILINFDLIEKKTADPHWNLEYNSDAFEVFSVSPNSKIFSSEEIRDIQTVMNKIVNQLKNQLLPEKLMYSLLHADIALEHARILPNGNYYFFDWTDRVWAPVSREIATLLFHLYREADISYERWNQLEAWVIEGYNQVNPLQNNDLQTIRPFILKRCLDEIKYLSRLAIREGQPIDVQGIARRFDLIKHLI